MCLNAAVFRKLSDLHEAGFSCAGVTLTGATGSVPQEVGAKMVVTESGPAVGTVGGGRVEDAAIRHARKLLAQESPAVFDQVEWNLQRDIGMTCGGVVRMAFEVFRPSASLVVIFGAGHVANALARVLIALDCRIFVYDSRSDWLNALPSAPNLEYALVEPLDEAVNRIPDGAFVAVMTQGHRSDMPILARILKTRSFPYLGVIGSPAKAGVLRRELLDAGVVTDLEKAFRCPIGLPIGRNTPEEIAISIAAELLQARDA